MDSPDLPRVAQLLHFAFAGPEDKCQEWLRKVGIENIRVVRDGPRIVACLVLIPMGQYFGGRSVRMTGVAGVAVAPEARGSGVAASMMGECMRELAGEGPAAAPLSGLYASTQALYRKVGFEQAGHFFHSTQPCRTINVTEKRGELRLLGVADDAAVRACYEEYARRFDGMLDRGPYIWDRVREFRGVRYEGFGVFGAESGDPERLEGYVFLSQDRLPESGRHDLKCTDFVFLNAPAGRRLLGMLANFSTMGEDLVITGGPLHPVATLLPQQTARAVLRDYWMTRITDLKAALEARGYAKGVSTSFELDVTDELAPRNAGVWSVKVADGRASVVRGGSARAAIRADIRGLAPIFTGLYSPAQAAMLGLVSGAEDALAAAAPAFAGGTPWMADPF